MTLANMSSMVLIRSTGTFMLEESYSTNMAFL